MQLAQNILTIPSKNPNVVSFLEKIIKNQFMKLPKMPSWKPLRELDKDLKFFGIIIIAVQFLTVFLLVRSDEEITIEDVITILVYLMIFFIIESILFIFYLKYKSHHEFNNRSGLDNEVKKQNEDLKKLNKALQSQINNLVKDNYDLWRIHSCTATLEFRKDGTAKYEKISELECLGENVSTFREEYWTDGRITSFHSTPGVDDNPEPVDKGKVFITKLKNALNPPDIITRRVSVEFDENSYKKDTETWQDNHYHDCSNTYFILKTHYKKYKTIRVFHIVDFLRVPIENECEINEELTGEIVKIKFPNHKIQRQFLIEWTW